MEGLREAKIISTAILFIFPLLGSVMIITKYIKMGRYYGWMGPIDFDEIFGEGTTILGIVLVVLGIAAIAAVWLFL